MSAESKYRFLLINAFSLAPGSDFKLRSFSGPKETQLYNYEDVKPFLEGIDWDLHPGAPATHGNWPVQSKWEFLSVGYNRQAVVREACESGKYNAIVLLGGGDPGYLESREIGRQHRIPVTSCAHAQMHMAGLLGHKFSRRRHRRDAQHADGPAGRAVPHDRALRLDPQHQLSAAQPELPQRQADRGRARPRAERRARPACSTRR